MKTIFEKIIDREIPSEIVFENERIIVIKDIAPVAPVHFLIVPKKVIPSIQELEPEDFHLLEEVVQVPQNLAREHKLIEGYRLLTNHGPLSGQTIFHLHFHLIGGRKLDVIG